MNLDTRIAQTTALFLDKPYFLGDVTKGYDCVSLIHDFYNKLGIELPRQYGGFTLSNYAEGIKQEDWPHLLKTYLQDLGIIVDVNYMLAGDLIIFERKGKVFPGIYVGNGNVLSAFERKGVLIIPLKFLRGDVIGVRTWALR